MTRRHVTGWILASVLLVTSGTLYATPEDCLALRANADVASCANRYAAGGAVPQSSPEPTSTRPSARQVRIVENPNLKTVPVVPVVASRVAAPRPEPAAETFAAGRAVLDNPIVAGAVGSGALILLVLAIWRARSPLSKTCRWCGVKLSRNARSCRRCLRAV